MFWYERIQNLAPFNCVGTNYSFMVCTKLLMKDRSTASYILLYAASLLWQVVLLWLSSSEWWKFFQMQTCLLSCSIMYVPINVFPTTVNIDKGGRLVRIWMLKISSTWGDFLCQIPNYPHYPLPWHHGNTDCCNFPNYLGEG